MAERYRNLSSQFAEQGQATAPQTPVRTHFNFPEMSFSPDTSRNDTVHQSVNPVVATVPEEQETLCTPPAEQPAGESDAPQEGAAAGAPGGKLLQRSPRTPSLLR